MPQGVGRQHAEISSQFMSYFLSQKIIFSLPSGFLWPLFTQLFFFLFFFPFFAPGLIHPSSVRMTPSIWYQVPSSSFQLFSIQKISQPGCLLLPSLLGFSRIIFTSHGAFRCRVMTIHGSEDEIVPLEDATDFAKLIPNHTLQIIEGADHGYSNHQAELGSLVLDFIISNQVKRSPGEKGSLESRL